MFGLNLQAGSKREIFYWLFPAHVPIRLKRGNGLQLIFEQKYRRAAVTEPQHTIDMAKELCMLQRTDKGKGFRLCFVEAKPTRTDWLIWNQSVKSYNSCNLLHCSAANEKRLG